MKISKFFKFVAKTVTVAVAIGSIVYIVKDIIDKKSSDNFDDTWDEDFEDDFDDMFEDDEEDSASGREYVKVNPSKMASDDSDTDAAEDADPENDTNDAETTK